jgi:hypothetical protein
MKERVFSTKSKVELMGVKNLLDSESIESFEINNVDSAHAGAFGYYELNVNTEDVEKARKIIERFQSEN